MLVELGKELKKIREEKGVSLDGVAAPAKISAAYLHKLEGGIVNNPSPRVLARLSVSLGTSYLRLLELAGYLDEKEFAEVQMREPSLDSHPLAGQNLTPDEWKAVGYFINSLIAKRHS